MGKWKQRLASMPKERKLTVGIGTAAAIGIFGALLVFSKNSFHRGGFPGETAPQGLPAAPSRSADRPAAASRAPEAAADSSDPGPAAGTQIPSSSRAGDSVELVRRESPFSGSASTTLNAQGASKGRGAPTADASRMSGQRSRSGLESAASSTEDPGALRAFGPGAPTAPGLERSKGKDSQTAVKTSVPMMPMPHVGKVNKFGENLKGFKLIRKSGNLGAGASGGPMNAFSGRGVSYTGPGARTDVDNGSGGDMTDYHHPGSMARQSSGKGGAKGTPFGSENADRSGKVDGRDKARLMDDGSYMIIGDGSECSLESDPKMATPTRCGMVNCMQKDTQRIRDKFAAWKSETNPRQIAADAMRAVNDVDIEWALDQEKTILDRLNKNWGCRSRCKDCGPLSECATYLAMSVGTINKSMTEVERPRLTSEDPAQGIVAIDLEWNFTHGLLPQHLSWAQDYRSRCKVPDPLYERCCGNPVHCDCQCSNQAKSMETDMQGIFDAYKGIQTSLIAKFNKTWCDRQSANPFCNKLQSAFAAAREMAADLIGHSQAVGEFTTIPEPAAQDAAAAQPFVDEASKYMQAVRDCVEKPKDYTSTNLMNAAIWSEQALAKLDAALAKWNERKGIACAME
ncbi:MAG: hypothetical protein HY922_08185 [Elusimicrobia bacterium]|nr:hypothetical protein [Elusimicrobiota bacterium]